MRTFNYACLNREPVEVCLGEIECKLDLCREAVSQFPDSTIKQSLFLAIDSNGLEMIGSIPDAAIILLKGWAKAFHLAEMNLGRTMSSGEVETIIGSVASALIKKNFRLYADNGVMLFDFTPSKQRFVLSSLTDLLSQARITEEV